MRRAEERPPSQPPHVALWGPLYHWADLMLHSSPHVEVQGTRRNACIIFLFNSNCSNIFLYTLIFFWIFHSRNVLPGKPCLGIDIFKVLF